MVFISWATRPHLPPNAHAAALFYRTQDSGHRTTGPGPDLNILIFHGEIPSAALILQMTSMCSRLQVQFSESNRSSIQLSGELRLEAVMDTDVNVGTGLRPLSILFICFCKHNIFVVKYCPNCQILVATFSEYLRQRWGHLSTSELLVASKVQQLKHSKLTPNWTRRPRADM